MSLRNDDKSCKNMPKVPKLTSMSRVPVTPASGDLTPKSSTAGTDSTSFLGTVHEGTRNYNFGSYEEFMAKSDRYHGVFRSLDELQFSQSSSIKGQMCPQSSLEDKLSSTLARLGSHSLENESANSFSLNNDKPKSTLPHGSDFYFETLSIFKESLKKENHGRTKRLFFCRHGETEPNNRRVLQGSGIDESLNERGLEQAVSMAKRLSDFPVDCVVSSHLKRAKETADEVAKYHLDASRVIARELGEISWGEWEGQRAPHMSELLSAWSNHDYEARAPAGESPADCVRRTIPAIIKLLELPHENIVVVIHGRLIRIILCYLIEHGLSHMSCFRHHNTCVNVVDVFINPHLDLGTRVGHLSHPQKQKASSKSDLYPNIETRDSIPTPILPKNIIWIPTVLDDYRHLPKELCNT